MHVLTTRRFEFSAAHRYWRDEWTPERNLEVFGVHERLRPRTQLRARGDGRRRGGRDDRHGHQPHRPQGDRRARCSRASTTSTSTRTPPLRGPPAHHREHRGRAVVADRAAAADGVSLRRLRLYETPDIFADYYGGETATLRPGLRLLGRPPARRPTLERGGERGDLRQVQQRGRPRPRLPGRGDGGGADLAETGMVMNLVDLDDRRGRGGGRARPHPPRPPAARLRRAAVDRREHRRLPVAAAAAPLGGRLRWVRLWETPNNIFELGAGLGLGVGR